MKTTPPVLRRVAGAKKARAREKKMKAARAAKAQGAPRPESKEPKP
jgi:hypothetical protein